LSRRGCDPRSREAKGRDGAAPAAGTCLALLGLLLCAAAPAPGPNATTLEFFPASAIRPGMVGTARTVFEGDTLEEFKVEFLGVLKGAIGPQQDMILARLRGEKVEYTGVVSGMSGSPVYMDGRLVGALSYRLGPFAKEAIAGITPIADMLRLADNLPRTGSRAATPAPDLLGPFLARGLNPGESGRGLSPGRAPTFGGSGTPAAASSGLRPIGTPLVCSGCDSQVLGYYAPIFEAEGLEPATGGGVASAAGPLPLLPGTAIGGALITGDLSLNAVGTLTHVDGNRVFAFGHPLLGIGSLEIPMTQAQVILTFASTAASFKIANATEPMGTVIEDGLTAIVGEVGRVAPMLPFKVRVARSGGERVFNYRVVKNRTWTPVMVSLATANSLVRSTEFQAGASLAMHYRIEIEGYPRVEVEDLYAGTNPGQPVHLALANDAGGLLNLLYGNPFEDLPVRSAEADIDVLQDSQVATISSLGAAVSEVRPGDPFTVTASLTPFRGQEREVRFEVALPEDTPPGEVQIVVAGGPAIDGLERRLLDRQVAQAGSLRDLLRLVTRQRKSRTLYLRVTRRSPSAIVRSEILPELPLSVFNVFNNPRLSADTTLMSEATILEVPHDLDVVVVGGRRIALRVK
jgi:hypothetical protein